MVSARLAAALPLLPAAAATPGFDVDYSPRATAYERWERFSAAAADAATSCEDKCLVAGHCCIGANAACQRPSCQMGCIAGDHTTSEAACNATCTAANKKCEYDLTDNITFRMCGDCPAQAAPAWWPAEVTPPAGQQAGWWPPGYMLPFCSSCDAIEHECMLGCVFKFRPSLKPSPPPEPVPPAPRPPPPACGVFPSSGQHCTPGGDVSFSNVFSDHAVLQMAPARAAVYGSVGTNAPARGAKVTVTVSAQQGAAYSVAATVDAETGVWKAFLRPAAAGGTYSVTAACDAGCTGSARIDDVTFGDVWYCAGQSNMALPVRFTYARNASIARAKAHPSADSIRITGLKGNMNADLPWTTLADAVGGAGNQTMPSYGDVPLDQFSSTCFYFGEALLEAWPSALPRRPIGLIHTAWGGSMIEEWVTNSEVAACKGADVADHNTLLYDTAVKPYLGMSLKGWVYYQGENNCGGLHGNSGTSSQPASGYACMMPELVSLWRKEWSKAPNTTDPAAPFGIVSLSSHDSEGAKDMASFRWAQQASYGTVPNARMPNTFMAHAFDLQDPWNSNKGACDTQPLEGYDCHTPWYMGAGIHPRLKKPVGQRLALGALQAAYGDGGGAFGGVIKGCSLSSGVLTLAFDMRGRQLSVRAYNRSDPVRSATAVLTGADPSPAWSPAHIALGSAPGTVTVDLSSLPAGTEPRAVRYAWGSTGKNSGPNGDDVSCCEGDGDAAPCAPAQCPLLAAEPRAPFGVLPVDPFIAEIAGGKCVCPEPQACAA